MQRRPLTQIGADDGILVLSSPHYDNSSDIVFECYNESGDIRWRNYFGGTGDEQASAVLNVEPGYYLIGSTYNWPDLTDLGVKRPYLIKTDLEGKSCQ